MSHNMDEDNDNDGPALPDVSPYIYTPSSTTTAAQDLQGNSKQLISDATESSFLSSDQAAQSARQSPLGSLSERKQEDRLPLSLAFAPKNALANESADHEPISTLRKHRPQGSPRSSPSTPRFSTPSVAGIQDEEPATDMAVRPGWTSSSVAKEYFRKDIEAHSKLESNRTPDAAVIFHDACYGHRYSRPKTSKANLNTIVERPERILAIKLGVSAAYVRLGGRHAEGLHSPHPASGPHQPPFLIRKSSRRVDIRSVAVTNVHGEKWMTELKTMCDAAESKLMQNGRELTRPRDPGDHSSRNKPQFHDGDLYLCAESLAAFEGALGGVVDAVDTVFSSAGPRRVFACVRPPGHHCSDDYPSGFCWLNNVHVGVSHAALEHGLTHAAMFDFDLHHGDGSQAIAWAHNAKASSLPKNAAQSKKTSIGYFSIHDINSYPCEWGDEDKVRNASLCIENAHGQNIWNIHLQPWKTKADFWKLYEERYSVLIDKMRVFLRTQHSKLRSANPSVPSRGAIFISAGFDASEWEGHGMQRHSVNVPTTFYARVTRDIVRLSQEEGLGVDGRIISVLEGGYSDRALASGILSHMCGLTSVHTDEVSNQEPTIIPQPSAIPYDTAWWSSQSLDELARGDKATPAAPTIKKSKPEAASCYITPTQSFVAKVASQPAYQRSVANSISRQSMASQTRARSPTPPPPEVGWATASYELSQLLIPQDRQTRSCLADDLNAKATEARKARQSTVGTATALGGESIETQLDKMNLKDESVEAQQMPAEQARAVSSRANRRKTFGGAETLEKEAPRKSSRRLSIASTGLPSVDGSFVKSSTPPVQVRAASKTRTPSKPRAPRKTATKPAIPKQTTTIKKSVALPVVDAPSSEATTTGVNPVDDLVSGMKNIRIKLNPPSRIEHGRQDTAGSAIPKESKKPVRAPRKPAAKKILPSESPSASRPQSSALRRGTPTKQLQSSSAPQAPIPNADSSSTIQASKQDLPDTTIDKLLFHKTPLDADLADYLSIPPTNKPPPPNDNEAVQAMSPSVDPEPIPIQALNPQSVSTAQKSTAPSEATTPKPSPRRDAKKTLPSFSPHGPIPFASVGQATAPSAPSMAGTAHASIPPVPGGSTTVEPLPQQLDMPIKTEEEEDVDMSMS